jgi:type I restriction enzyme S subunit
MAGEWKRTSLREAGVTLIDCDHRTPPAADSGYPYVAIPQLKEGRLALADARRISPEHFADWTRKAKPQHHDVILSRRCNPGETAFVPAGLECALGQNLVLLRSDGTKVFPPFLRWLLNGPDWWEQVGTFINVGAIFNSLKCADIPNFKMPLPPIAEQKRIAHILGTLDDKIELNRRMNATLEAMARALFQSWFIDFDPVRRNMDRAQSRPSPGLRPPSPSGRGAGGEGAAGLDFDPVRAKLDGRQSVGIDETTTALFPDSFQVSALGHIPNGWDAIPLYDTAQWVNGAAFKNEDFCATGQGLPVIKIAELKDGIGPQTKWSQRDAGEDKIIDTGDLLYSWSGSPDTSLEAFLWSGGRGLLNQHIFKVISATAAEKRFVYYLLQYLRPVLVETARNKQTTGLGHVTIADMKRLLVCMPSKAVLTAFDRNVAPIFDKAFTNTLESRTLTTLRDTLLPKLLRGELNISSLP